MPLSLLVLAVLAGPTAPAPPSGISGAVSPLIPALCRPQEAGTPAGEGVLRCAGLVGTDVFLRGAEAARELALARPEGFLPPAPDGGRLGRSLSWRLLGDRPLAAVVRYRFPEGPEGSADVLLVLKPARGDEPGCLVGAIEDGGDPAGPAPERAAALADRRAPLFRCGRDRATLEGAWSPAGRARMASWFGPMASGGD